MIKVFDLYANERLKEALSAVSRRIQGAMGGLNCRLAPHILS
jgi:hypothetical protein